MPSTVYRGDLSEITFGHESGLVLAHNYNSDSDFTFTAKAGTWDKVADTSVIVLAGGTADTPVAAAKLAYPVGMLVGSKVVFETGGDNFSSDDDASTGKSFTIVKHAVVGSATELTITPAMTVNHSSGKVSSGGDVMHILPYKTPSMDVGMAYAAAANASTERVLTDQFVGLVGTVALPETVVDLKRLHVVGLGRDVAVQVPGKFINTGGSFECNIHNARWFYYALGHEVVKMPLVASGANTDGNVAVNTQSAIHLTAAPTGLRVGDAVFNQHGQFVGHISAETRNAALSTITCTTGTKTALVSGETLYYSPAALCAGGTGTTLSAATNPGDSYITYSGTTVAELSQVGGSNTHPAAGDYVWIVDSGTTDIKVNRETTSDGTWPVNGADSIISAANKIECRRIVAINNSKIWLDDPLNFAHASATNIYFSEFSADNGYGSPHMETSAADYGNIQNPVERLLFSRTTVPSFAMEVSVRRNDNEDDTATDGSVGDTKQLTRVFRGCKVKDFSLKADTDAALKMAVNFDAALCYTDTGRLENNTDKGDRYDCHRLFEDTANTEQKRKESGIAKRTQKPFMFYNGIIKVKGVTLGQVSSFTLNGSSGVQQYYTITGNTIADAETDQIPFGGSRNPAIAVEGKTEYSLALEIIVDDPVFYHNMRRAVDNFDDNTSDATDADMIRLSFTKQGAGSVRESMDIIIDDYFITEAPLPIPEDKGPMRSSLKIMPKSMHVIAKDTLKHS
jgi:hypothetical protein